jgi:SAM-dependent methyltransferase
MKLSRLVAYARHLDRFDTARTSAAMVQHLDPMIHTVGTHELQFRDFADQLRDIRADIDSRVTLFDRVLENLRQELQTNIEALEPHYLHESYNLYSQGMVNDSNQHILERRPQLTPDAENYVRARIMRHGDWHYPGMILRPGLESWITDLVALDPLYLVDINLDIMQPALERFNPEYQNRLRRYVIQESMEHVMMADLPQAQMSMILAYNYFNFKPLELIRCFLAELYQCLKPGGTLMFTFNNCDRAGGVDLAERYFMCYTPGRLVLAAAEMLGFEVTHTYDIDAAATWVELRRSGTLVNHRGGQALARIVANSHRP